MSTALCLIPFLASILPACAPPPPLAMGYVEGEFVLVAPIGTARIESVAVKRGDRVTPGERLATLEHRDAEIALAQAGAALAQNESRLADLKQGLRPEEIAALAASLRSAQVQADEANREAARQKGLFSRGVISQAQLDSANTAVEVARASVAEFSARLDVARLPARKDQIDAAQAAVGQTMAARDAAAWRLAQRVVRATVPGRIFDTLRNPGELAGPQAPLLSMLPDGAVKLKLYVPEARLASLSVGARLRVRCDGCGDQLAATVSYISPDPEFTPPVIYSRQNRQKLVYLIEALPDAAGPLKPGQIVDVDFADPRK